MGLKWPRGENAPMGMSWGKGEKVVRVGKGRRGDTYSKVKPTKPIPNLLKNRTNRHVFLFVSMQDETKTCVASEPYLADCLFEVRGGCVWGVGGGVRSLFEGPGCPEGSELVSD